MSYLWCVDIESAVKDSNVLWLPSERYSPVRRLSDGLTMVRRYRSQLDKIYKKALQNQVRYSSLSILINYSLDNQNNILCYRRLFWLSRE